jgi:hypothetical protein
MLPQEVINFQIQTQVNFNIPRKWQFKQVMDSRSVNSNMYLTLRADPEDSDERQTVGRAISELEYGIDDVSSKL